MDLFGLTNADLDMCLEIPSDDSGEFDPVELHAHFHGGDSQLWRVGPGGRVVSALDPTLCLGTFSAVGDLGATRRIRDGESVVLVNLASEFALTFKWSDGNDLGNSRSSYNKSTAENEMICMQDSSLRLGSAARGHGIELQSSPCRGQTWTLTPQPTPRPKPLADPTSSCIIRYGGVIEGEVEDSWTLQCRIDLKSCNKCVVGWGPGGY